MINYKDESVIEFSQEQEQEILMEMILFLERKLEGSIIDYILEYCEVNEYRVEEVADLIKSNKMIRDILEQDCVFHGILENKNKLQTENLKGW